MTSLVTSLAAEPGGPGISHQFFRKSKNPKASFDWEKGEKGKEKKRKGEKKKI